MYRDDVPNFLPACVCSAACASPSEANSTRASPLARPLSSRPMAIAAGRSPSKKAATSASLAEYGSPRRRSTAPPPSAAAAAAAFFTAGFAAADGGSALARSTPT